MSAFVLRRLDNGQYENNVLMPNWTNKRSKAFIWRELGLAEAQRDAIRRIERIETEVVDVTHLEVLFDR